MKATCILIAVFLCYGVYFEFQNPLVFDPRSSEQYTEKAYALMHKKKFDQAVVFLRKAIELNPDNKRALFSCKQLYFFYLGDQPKQQKIIDLCSYVIQKSPGNIDAYRYLMIAHFERNEVEKALSTMREALKRNPNDAQAHLVKATAFNWTGEHEKAAKSISDAIKIDSTDAYSYVFRGNEYIGCEQYQKAADDYSKALSLNANCATDYSVSFGALKQNLAAKGFIAGCSELHRISPGLKPEGIETAESHIQNFKSLLNCPSF